MRRTGLTTLLLALASTPALAGPARVVATEAGPVGGTDERGVVAYRGIPYAAPPVGPLRWRPPAPAPAWRGPRDGSRFGAACPQPGDHKEAWARVGPTSEDCLFLNVWRPARTGRYPVMVFFHGGAFTYGSGGVPLYDGASLARNGVVLVTINYRLGRLGFFAHPALTAEDPGGELGNYGMMDAVASLKWIRRNIARFGGDPANVTIFGESAGAGFVQLLMGSPAADGLYARAISQSGSGGAALAPIRGAANAAEAAGAKWVSDLGLPDATAAQLRALPAERLLARSFPFIDGRVVVASPGVSFRAGREAKVPLIIGANSNEATLASNNAARAQVVLGTRYAEFAAGYAARPGVAADAAPVDLAEDALSVLPSLSNGAMHAANGAPAWGYHFTQVPSNRRAGSAGSPHGGEVEYLFGNPDEGMVWDEADRRVSREMQGYWTRFARTGDPNGGGAPRWPGIGRGVPNYLVIAPTSRAAALTPLEEAVRRTALDAAVKSWEPAGATK